MCELRKCSRCHSTKLVEYFSLNNKGELFKLCNNCRKTQRRDVEINVARQQFINEILEKSGNILEYKHILNPDDIDFPTDNFKALTGEELLVEYHLFYIKSSDTNIIQRWRLMREKQKDVRLVNGKTPDEMLGIIENISGRTIQEIFDFQNNLR